MTLATRAAKEVARAVSPRRTRTPRRSRDGESPSTSQHVERRVSRRLTRTPKESQTGVTQELELTDEHFVITWGITKEEEEHRLVEFRKIVEADVGPLRPLFDKYYLRRFLRARQHDLPRAKDMFLAHLKWRAEYGVDTIMQDFDFHERDAFLTLYPQGYHKTDRLGRPIYIQHLGQINMRALQEVTTDERMLRFHVQEYERALRYIFPACSIAAGCHVSQTLAIMDLKGVGLRHLSGEVKRILTAITRTDQDNYPETLGKTLIINAPTVFRAIWAIVKPMLDVRTQAKIEVCPADYMKVLTRWAVPENIPTYLGGLSQGSLIDDIGPWEDPAMMARIDAEAALRDGLPAAPPSEEHCGGVSGGALEAAGRGPLAVAQRSSESAAAEPLLPSSKLPSESVAAAPGIDSGVEGDVSDDEFQDALTRRLSSYSSASSAYLSAEEDTDLSDTERFRAVGGRAQTGRAGTVQPANGSAGLLSVPFPNPPAALHIPEGGFTSSADEDSDAVAFTAAKDLDQTKPYPPAPAQQISILARVRALEERLPVVEGRVRKHLPQSGALASRGVGQGTLVARVGALEAAMEMMLVAQEAAMDEAQAQQQQRAQQQRRGCCSGCALM